MEEVWKDIRGWEGLYQISNLGRVKSLPRLHSAIHPYITKERILAPRVCGKDREYLNVALCNDKKRVQLKIHRLVADAFIPNPFGYKEVNHKDENKGNNVATNLEWCSRSFNVNYGSRIKKQRAKLTQRVAQYDMNGNFIKEYPSFADAAESVNGYSANISHVVSGRRQTYKGFIWKKICTK